MPLRVDLEADGVVVRLSWWSILFGCARTVRLAYADVARARGLDRAEVGEPRKIRLGGGYWPGRMATGWFGWRSPREFWYRYRPERVLVVEARAGARPARLVLQVDDPDGLAARIEEHRP